ncbi:hypothetical protein AS026_19535 [Rhizobium altiplani]|uniref:Holin n=1 Tax=Rhizobium altiplani TaxID=1864509 RepID=A0A109J7U2_9HYPH|nr:hypothetical protein AS026_19535 [Rhizobium altiplani]
MHSRWCAVFEGITAFLIGIGINPTHVTAGLAGALVRSLLNKGASKWEKISGGFVGTLCAAYLTPLVVQWMALDITQFSTINAVAFGIGIVGMSLAEGAVRMAQSWAEKPRLPSEASLKGLADAINVDEGQETPDPKPASAPKIDPK